MNKSSGRAPRQRAQPWPSAWFIRRRVAIALPALAALLYAGVAWAQQPTPSNPDGLRSAPPEIDQSRPGGDPAAPASASTPGGDPAGIARGVVRPPRGIDPGIQGTVPNPTPGTTPVIPPPGTPGGAPSLPPK